MTASTWSFRVGLLSDVGQIRERNEDAMTAFLPYGGEASPARGEALFLVADGMGGHEAGDRASAFVATAVRDWFTRVAPSGGAGGNGGAGTSDGAGTGAGTDGGRTFPEELCTLLEATNRDLVELGRREGLAQGAGSTATVACFHGGRLHVAHVGDTRLYRLRGGELEQLTRDHSWVAEQRRAGLMDEAEAASHPQRHMLTECLGVGPDVTVFTATREVRAGDRLLLCSDGLHGPLDAAMLAEVLATEDDPQQAARRLVALANHRSGPDNITAVVVHVHGAAAGGEGEGDAPATASPAMAVTVPGIEWTGAPPAPGAQATPSTSPAPAATLPNGVPVAASANPSPPRALRVTHLERLLLAVGVLALMCALMLAERSVRGGGGDTPQAPGQEHGAEIDLPPSPRSVPEEGTMASPQGRTPGETQP